MRQLLPSPATGVDATEVDLGALYGGERSGPAGRPWVMANFVASLDGSAAVEGRTRALSGPADRALFMRLRAQADVVLVGAGTVRADDPSLTARAGGARQPQRVVLGRAPAGARVQPAWELSGELGAVLDELGGRGIVQLLVEGGAAVAHRFHAAGLVDRYVLYLAPALFGGDDARGMFAGAGAPSLEGVWRGRLVDVSRLGEDLRVELAPVDEAGSCSPA